MKSSSNYFGHGPKILYYLSISSLLILTSYMGINYFIPMWLREDLGIDVYMVGYVLSSLTLVKIIFRFPGGWLSEYYGYNIIVTLSLLLYVFTYFSITWMWPTLFLLGISAALYWPNMYSYVITFFSRRDSAFKFGIFRGVTTVGYIIGPIIAGYIYNFYGFNNLAYFSAILSIIAFLIFMPMPRLNKGDIERLSFTRSMRKIFRGRVVGVILAVALEGLALGIFWIAFPYYVDWLGFDKSIIGLAIGLTSIFSPIASVIWGYITKKYKLMPIMFSGLLLGGTCVLGYTYAYNEILLLILAGFSSVGFSAFFTLWPIYVANYIDEKSLAISTIMNFSDIASVIGPTLGGILFLYSPKLPIILDAVLVYLAATALWLIR